MPILPILKFITPLVTGGCASSVVTSALRNQLADPINTREKVTMVIGLASIGSVTSTVVSKHTAEFIADMTSKEQHPAPIIFEANE